MYNREITKCKMALGLACFALAVECVVFEYDLCRYLVEGKGLLGVVFGAVGAIACVACVFLNCRTIARYAVMNKEWEQIEKWTGSK